ncbi:MAG: tRNA 4-thiouridine(8) synthase ThiI [Deltaproteobacteria bacterium]|nr:tRNA 4-thiouridine(8) synthase ThiI [Deltaproteobacteria bacterium]
MRSVLVRYHEVALKKGNRRYFIERLKENLVASVRDLGFREIKSLPGRILVLFERESDTEEIRRRVQSVFGVANFSFAVRTEPDLALLKQQILTSLEGTRFASFRVQTKRADKRFPLTSPEIDRQLGAAIQEQSHARVDLENAELTIAVEVLPDDAFFGYEKIPGAGGLPVGVSGRVVALISGGIDSPVAAYRMMRRGCRLVYVHFHSFPFLDATSQHKVRELVQLLTRHQFRSRLYLVPFGEIQRRIVASVLRPLRVVLYRRMMLRIAEAIARKEKASALVTGESLGQVASQTLANLSVIEEASRLLILRPLVGMDKSEIIDQARKIGTFEISVIPDQDCCQLFVPRHPATNAGLAEVLRAESALDIQSMIDFGIENVAIHDFHFPELLPKTISDEERA